MASKPSAGLQNRIRTATDPFLRVYQEGEFVRNYQIKAGITVVGREGKVDISLPHMGVSRRHFQIEYTSEGTVFLQDLKSQNGTLVNGEKAVRTSLQHADQIRVGPFELVLSFHSAATAPKIIAFPDVRTLPGIDVRKPSPPTQVAKRPSHLVRALESFAGILLMVVVAVVLAWMAWRWTKGGPEVVVAPAPEMPSVAQESPRTIPVRPRRPREEKDPEADLSRSLDKSLQGVPGGDLRAADRLVASAPVAPGRKEGHAVQRGNLESVSVEMPAVGKNSEGKREPGPAGRKGFDPVRYREMLTSKVGSVESCYVANVPSGGQAGKISVWLTIASEGEIRKSGIADSTISNQALQDCIVKQMLATRVDPPPWDGFTVTYTFRFGSGKVDF